MPNPYEDTESAEEPDSNLLSELRDEGVVTSTDGEGDVDIVAGDPVTDEEEGDAEETSRQRGKRERGERFRARRREEDDENQQLREQLAEVRGRLDAMQSSQVSGSRESAKNPYDDRRSALEEEQDSTLHEYETAANLAAKDGKSLSKEDKDKFVRRNRESMRRMARLEIEEARAEEDTPTRRAQRQLQAQYPDVMGDPNSKAANLARVIYEERRLMGQITADNNQEQMEKVMGDVRRRLKMAGHKNPPKATDKDRSSYGSMGRSGGPQQKTSKAWNPSKNPAEARMVLAMYSHLDLSDKQKYQKYVNEGGREE